MKTKVFFFAAISLFFLSCEEEEESGYGDLALIFNNSRTTREAITIYLDDAIKAPIFFVQPQQSYSTSIACDDKAYAASLDNIIFLNYVSSGSHTIKIEDYTTKRVLWEHDITMKANGCGAQPYQFVP